MDFPTSDADFRPFINRDIRLISKKSVTYSRMSALGPVGHCTSRFKRAVCISCRPRVDMGEAGGGPKTGFFVDVINGWPLTYTNCLCGFDHN